MEKRIYNLLKLLNRIVVPAFASVYFAFSKWGDLPNETVVLGILVIVATGLGIIVQLGAKRFEGHVIFQGEMVVTETREGKKVFSLELNRAPEELAEMEMITFKVVDIKKQALAD